MEIKFEAPIFDQNGRPELPPTVNTPQQPFQAPESHWRKKVVIAAVILTVFTIGVSSLVFLRNNKKINPNSSQVSVTVQGPSDLASGNEAQYVVIYQNGENADLLDVSMEVFYSSGFKFTAAEPTAKSGTGQAFDLPVLRQGQQAEVNIRGKLTGKIDEEKEVRVRLHYRLSNFNSEFSVEGSLKTRMLAPKLLFEVNGPIDVTNGQDITFTLNYTNVSDQELDNLSAKANYPVGFKFTTSNPLPSKENNIWNIGKLAPGATGKIDVKGSFTGDQNSEKIVVGELGININNVFAPQITASSAFKIVASSLSLIQRTAPADFTSLDKPINYTLTYANYGSIGMSNVVISLTLEGAAIDFSKLKADKAIVTGNTLTWKAATVPELSLVQPNKSGVINFSVPIKQTLTTNIKNQVVRGVAQIYSDQVTNAIKAADVEVKLSSELTLLVNGKYAGGAQPMQVGQSTTFAVTLILTNFSNDLDAVSLIASVPLPESAWTNVIVPDTEKDKLTFDSNSSKIRWKVGAMPAFTGKFSPARTVTFNLDVVPNSNDQIILLKDVMASGNDTFIDKIISSTTISEFRTSDID